MTKKLVRLSFALLLASALLGVNPSFAGGPLLVFEPTGEPIIWLFDPIPFNPDQGPLGTLDNATAVAFTNSLFQVWQDVPSSSVAYQNAGQLAADVATPAQFIAAINNPFQSPIIFDADGSLFAALGFGAGVLGFAGPNFLLPTGTGGAIFSGLAALNGRFLDGNAANGELTVEEFEGVFVHEFGHYSGLDHSQVNGIKFFIPSDSPGNPVQPLDGKYVETMFPFLATAEQRTPHRDDIAHISSLYPAAGATSVFSPTATLDAGAEFGVIRGEVTFADEVTPVQGINVIARNNSDKFGDAVSFVSGTLYTGNQFSVDFNIAGAGPADRIGFYVLNNLTENGNYKVEIEEINAAFTGGSSVGPQSPPLDIVPGGGGFVALDFFNNQESGSGASDNPSSANPVKVRGLVSDVDLALNDFGPDPNEPNDSLASATVVPFPGVTTGDTMIHPAADADYYRFSLAAQTTVEIATVPFFPGAATIDTTLVLFTGAGLPIAADDDSGGTGIGTFSRIRIPLPPGDYIAAVGTFPLFPVLQDPVNENETSIGTYRLSLSEFVP